LEARFTVGHRPVYVPAVMGIATCSDGYSHGPELLGQAALAANSAIVEGQRSALFRPGAKEERISLLQLEADLQAAIDGNELRLFFQPIVSVNEGHVVGFESLIRWQHPTESWIGPDRFIPLAESMGQMARISDWVLRQGVAHSKQFAQLRAEPLYITVNLTPRDLNRELCSRLFALLDSVRLPPQCIRIEITETAVVRDFRIAARLIAELNERGVRVLLDDFGTGYSSLSYLRDLPFHAVKIDRSFIHKMTTEARDFGLVKSIVGLVHYLGMECIAEGVETQEQLDLIGMMDCNYWQGFLFSRPLPASQIEPLLHDTRRKPGVALVATS
jgi:EAL domain-containing protein (putative c-di-GMP-specific phosphodiesterase class I)